MDVRRWMRTTALTIAVGLVVFAPAGAHASSDTNDQQGDVAPQQLLADAAANPGATFQVIVTTDPGSPVQAQGSQLKDQKGKSLAKITKSFNVINAHAADVTGAQLLDLTQQPGIVSVTPDAPIAPDSLAPVPPQVWLQAAGVAGLPASPSAPAIAIVDSGVTPGSSFGKRLVSVNVSSDSQGKSDQYDQNGHGTLVAGIAAGASAAYPGAAPTARLVSLKVVGADGSARTSDVIAAADWIYRNRDTYGIRVANFSLHSSAPASALVDPLDLAVRKLWLTGTVVVAAAGNDGQQRMLYAPGSDPFVITVGAVGTNGTPDASDDSPPAWSSYGYTADGFAKPELTAPGRYMVGPTPTGSTLATTFADRLVAPNWIWMSGTSFSAPVVSGIAARLLALHPDWTPDQVKGALMVSATPLESAPDLSVGTGEVNAARAAAIDALPNPNAGLAAYVRPDANGIPTLDGDAWTRAVADASWVSASWVSASWVSASWVSASWVSASWVSSAYADASWVSASWVSASWVSGTSAP
jgi:serine protease AprX